MRVDREGFLKLCAALSMAACPGRQADATAAPVIDVQPTPASAKAPVAPVTTTAETTCSNQGRELACGQVGPACEGLHQECLGLSDDLQPAIAAAWSECFAEARPPGCRDPSLGACMRRAIEESCAEPDTRPRCQEVMTACRNAGREPGYTLKQCMQVASAVKAGPGGWVEVDWKRMGPDVRTAPCSLEYVLPFQPFGWMWR